MNIRVETSRDHFNDNAVVSFILQPQFSSTYLVDLGRCEVISILIAAADCYVLNFIQYDQKSFVELCRE